MVAVFDGNTELFFTTFHQALLAPDCKIYLNTFANVKTLHVIHNPNERGIACGVEQHALDLPHWNAKTIPNFPNYRLGPFVPGQAAAPPCEEGPFVVDTPERLRPRLSLRLFPNPARDVLTAAFNKPLPQRGTAALYNLSGQQLRSLPLSAGQTEARFSVEALPPGLYFCRLLLADGTFSQSVRVVVQ